MFFLSAILAGPQAALAQSTESTPVESTPGVTGSLISPKAEEAHVVRQAFGVGLSIQNKTDATVL